MPKANDLDRVSHVVEAVNDAVRANNDFANERVSKLRHHPAKFRGLREKPGSRNQK
jgi:hypothetical protein